MRVLVVTHNYPRFPGDRAGAFVARLATLVAERGSEVHVVAPHAPGASEEQRDGDVQVRRFRYAPEALERIGYTGVLHRRAFTSPLTMAGLLPYFAAFRRAIAREVDRFQPALVHAHWWMPAGWLTPRRLPYIVTCHGSDVRLLEHAALRRLARPVLSQAAAVTTVSRFLAQDIRAALPDVAMRTMVTPMPVDVAHFASGRTAQRVHPPRILYAGNLVPSKGVDVLVEAFHQLRQRGVACELRILGGGPVAPSLHALARRLGVFDQIQWMPFVPQTGMPAEYGASTITVLPSRGQAEGLGLTLVEALLAGCAVVGTPAGGIPEVVVHEETGLLARGGDARDLARQIERLLTDAALRNRLTREGCERCTATFAPDVAAARVLALYEDVVASTPLG
ncbi:MAG TPA: glycosyltransferase family 4 protein [Gemmatimonadaceae bacterium]|nr:glycosyltransferase family 4 protein [Gemmatimonadaceae bacterium]